MIALLLLLGFVFAELSLLAFGGCNSVLPEMHRVVVDQHHWMSASEFTTLFALAQAAPGPNMMIVPLIGWRVAGAPGALVCAIAMFGPPSLLTAVTLRLWQRFRDHPLRVAAQRALGPLTVGLVAASAWLITLGTAKTPALLAVTAGVAATAATTRLHPLWLLGTGAVLGLSGLLS